MSTPASPNAVVLVKGANSSAIFKEIKENRQRQGQAKAFDKNAKTQVSGVSNSDIFAHDPEVKSVLKLRDNTTLSSQEVTLMRSHGGYVAEIAFDDMGTDAQGQKTATISILDIDHAAVNADTQAKVDPSAAPKVGSKPTAQPYEDVDPVLAIQLESEDAQWLENLIAGDQDSEVVLSPSEQRVLEEIDLAWSAHETENGMPKPTAVELERDFQRAHAQVIGNKMDGIAHQDTLRASSVMNALRRQLKAAQRARENGIDAGEITITVTGPMKKKLRNMVQTGNDVPVSITRAHGTVYAEPNEAFA